MTQVFNLDHTKTFIWGISQTKRIKNLRIEGQPVTNVIEVEMDGEPAFFWYFDDLTTDIPLSFSDLNKQTEGEVVITID